MAISFVGAGTAVFDGTGAFSASPHADTTAGDYVVAYVALRGNITTESTITTPSGWTQLTGSPWYSTGSAGRGVALFAKTADGSDGFSSTLTEGGAGGCVIVQLATFRGVDTADPIGSIGSITHVDSLVQDIALSAAVTVENGQAVIAVGVKTDDWTSAATVSGTPFTFAEIGELDSSLEDDIGFVWDYAINTGASQSTGTSGAFAVSGGTTDATSSLYFTLKPATSGASTVSPTTGTLVFQGYAPTLGTGSTISPAEAALTFQGYAPSLNSGSRIAVAETTMAFTGYAPTLGANSSIAPSAAAIVFQGYAPTLTGIRAQVAQVPVVNNLEQLRRAANDILDRLQQMLPAYGPNLPATDDDLDGRLFVKTSDMTLYQQQNGAWVAVDMVP